MKTKFLNRSLLAVITAMFLVLTSCFDKDHNNEPKVEQEGEPSLLDFATTKSVNINLEFPDAQKGTVDAINYYAENPLQVVDGKIVLRNDISPVSSNIITGGKVTNTEVIPGYVNVLYAYSTNSLSQQLLYAPIENGIANFEEFDLDTMLPEKVQTKTLSDNKIDLYLSKSGPRTLAQGGGDINGRGRPEYIVGTKAINAQYINRLNSAFKEGKKASAEYHKDAVLPLYKPTEIKISIVTSEAQYDNTLSYYYVEGQNGKPVDLSTVNKEDIKEIVILPLAKLRTDSWLTGKGLKRGEQVALKYYDKNENKWVNEFPAGVTVGFILRSDAYNWWASGKVGAERKLFNSYSPWNTASNGQTQTIFFDGGEVGDNNYLFCFGFDDQPIGSGDGDCNDIIFNIDMRYDALEEPPIVIPNPEDVYTYLDRSGILAFEDQWPLEADYDLNDVVIEYQSHAIFVQKYQGSEPVGSATVVSVSDIFTLSEISTAQYENGFAYKVNIPYSKVKSIEINKEMYSPNTDSYNNEEGFIIRLSSNIKPLIGKEYEVKIVFKDGEVLAEDFDKVAAPYNPYIWNKAGCEIHLPKMSPTGNADHAFFGQGADKSDPENGLYYVGLKNGEKQFPFAIHLSTTGFDEERRSNFRYQPKERIRIDEAYPNYAKWVDSWNGSEYTGNNDWYLHPGN